MGKGVLFMIAAVVMAGSLMLHQSTRSSFEADAVQSKQQSKVLAREIARSAYNAASAQARDLEEQGQQPEDIVDALGNPKNTTVGSYQGGRYEYWAELVQGSTYRIGARGVHGAASYVINGARTMRGLLTIPEGPGSLCQHGCKVKVTFEQSQAGYCSAVFLQRLIPKASEHADGLTSWRASGGISVDDQELLQTLENRYVVLEPEMVFEADNRNRNGQPKTHETTLNPGEQMNFVLGVDRGCNGGVKNEDVAYTHSGFDWRRYALTASSEDFTELKESKWAITEQDPSNEAQWRIAFEDLQASKFTDAQLEDIKVNGYPDRNGDGHPDPKSDVEWRDGTYGGRGWKYETGGQYIDIVKFLYDYGDIPDYSDQVFYVELVPNSASS